MRHMTERYVEKGNGRRHIFSGSLIFRVMTLKTRGKFGSLMNYHSSAKLTLAKFRYMIKWVGMKLFFIGI